MRGFGLLGAFLAAGAIAGERPPTVDDEPLLKILPFDAIRSIDHPTFVPAAEAGLGDDEPVLGVVRGDAAKAYPVALLGDHDVVNDEIGGEPVAVTYCPLAGAGAVFARPRIEGEAVSFGVAGSLFRDALVMYDRTTRSLWSQATGSAIDGPEKGRVLEKVAFTRTTWGKWRARHPRSVVLSSAPQDGHRARPRSPGAANL